MDRLAACTTQLPKRQSMAHQQYAQHILSSRRGATLLTQDAVMLTSSNASLASGQGSSVASSASTQSLSSLGEEGTWDAVLGHPYKLIVPVSHINIRKYKSEAEAEEKKQARAEWWAKMEVVYRIRGGLNSGNTVSRNVIYSPSSFSSFSNASIGIPIVDAVASFINGVIMLLYARARLVKTDWKNKVLKGLDFSRAISAFLFCGFWIGALASKSQGLFTAALAFLGIGAVLTFVKDSFEFLLSRHDLNRNKKMIDRVSRRQKLVYGQRDLYRSETINALIKKRESLSCRSRAYARLSLGSLLIVAGIGTGGFLWVPGVFFQLWGTYLRLSQALHQIREKKKQKIAHKLFEMMKQYSDSKGAIAQNANWVDVSKLIKKGLKKLPGGRFGKWAHISRFVGRQLGAFREWLYNGQPYRDHAYIQYLKIKQVRDTIHLKDRSGLEQEWNQLDGRVCRLLGAEKIILDGVVSYHHNPQVNPQGFAEELVCRWQSQDSVISRSAFELISDILGPQKMRSFFLERQGSEAVYSQTFIDYVKQKLEKKYKKQNKLFNLTPDEINACVTRYLINRIARKLA